MMNVKELIDLIIYGDIHEAPLNLLKENFTGDELDDFDVEQMTRVSLAATIQQLVNQNKLRI